jgi:hypothetical protein
MMEILLTVKSATCVQGAGTYPAPPPHPAGTQSEKIQRDPTKTFSCHLSKQQDDSRLDQLVRVFIVLGLDPTVDARSEAVDRNKYSFILFER